MKDERFGRVREYLDQVRKADEKVKKLEMRREILEALATDIAQHMNGPTGHGKADCDRTGRLATELCDAEQELAEARNAAAEIREKVGKMICRIGDERIARIMLKRFIQGMKWKDIADDTMYSEQRIYELRLKGFEEMERLLSAGCE